MDPPTSLHITYKDASNYLTNSTSHSNKNGAGICVGGNWNALSTDMIEVQIKLYCTYIRKIISLSQGGTCIRICIYVTTKFIIF